MGLPNFQKVPLGRDTSVGVRPQVKIHWGRADGVILRKSPAMIIVKRHAAARDLDLDRVITICAAGSRRGRRLSVNVFIIAVPDELNVPRRGAPIPRKSRLFREDDQVVITRRVLGEGCQNVPHLVLADSPHELIVAQHEERAATVGAAAALCVPDGRIETVERIKNRLSRGQGRLRRLYGRALSSPLI